MGLTLGINLKIYNKKEKRLKLKFREFWGLIPRFVEVTGEKLVGEGGGAFCPPPPLFLNRVNIVKVKIISISIKYLLNNS